MKYLIVLFCFFCLSCDNRIHFESISSEQTETFLLKQEKAPLDLLVVVDSSQSMYHHLDKLGRSLLYLLSVISDYDWQIAFTTVDHGDHENPLSSVQARWKDNIYSQNFGFGRLMPLDNGVQVLEERFLTKEHVQFENIFYHTLSHNLEIDCNRPPYCAHRLEQPLRALKSSFERAVLDNGDFFRPQADLVTLIITNEEERSEDRQRGTRAQEVLQTFYKIFGSSKKLINYNILVQDDECLAQEQNQGGQEFGKSSLGVSISELAFLTGGENINICSSDYGPSLETISNHIKISLENSVTLEKEPLKGSIRMDFHGDSPLPWTLFGRKIVFHPSQKMAGKVTISYQISD